MSTSTVPMFDQGGKLRDVPAEQMAEAVQHGMKPSVRFQFPGDNNSDGTPKTRYVPADQTSDAVKNKGKLLPIEQQDVKHPGFWSALGSDLEGMAKGGVSMLAKGPTATATEMAEQIGADDVARKSEGRSMAYRMAAPAAQFLTGANVRGMEESANQGDMMGVLGHAAGPPAAMALTAGAAKGAETFGPALSKAAATAMDAAKQTTPKQVAQAIGGVSGGVAGHGTLSAPGAYYGAKTAGNIAEGLLGKERANSPLIAGKPPMEQPAPFPEKPAQELLQANALAEGGKPGSSPSDALAGIPVKAVTKAMQELGPTATVAQVATKAQTIAKLSGLLNESLGAKELKPDVPLKDQLDMPKRAEIPEGHTAVDSTALKSYSYDPKTQEFESVTQGGQHYIHGDVSPEQAQAFMDADSKGRAWAELRKNSTLVAKVVNGKRVAVKPSISSDEAGVSDEEWQAGHELDTQVEGTRKKK